jgi:hypothetical protein
MTEIPPPSDPADPTAPSAEDLIARTALDGVWRWFVRGLLGLCAIGVVYATCADRHRSGHRSAKSHGCSVKAAAPAPGATAVPCVKRTG